jgi:SAM-dependent methyltransferase
MPQRYTLDEIRTFWQRQALEHGPSPAASWSDQPVIEMEIRNILSHLQDGERVLDIGCANGFSTLHFAALKQLDILGLDYIPEMIREAEARLAGMRAQLRGTAAFRVGNIMSLDEPDESYDKVVVIRVVINLGDWENQIRAIMECSRMLRRGGLLLLSEATLQGWNKLNLFRHEWGLPDIPMPPFNNYLDEERVVAETSGVFDLVDLVNFASTYFVGTRVLKPLLIQALKAGVNVADPNLQWNRWFSQLPAAGDYGTQKLFVLRKR